jgi:predicted MFS family arabinose efflux permease
MGIYTLGISIGIMIAYLAGGWVVQNVGWREAFFVVGIPGLLLALLVRFTVTEPLRGLSENRADSRQRPQLLVVARFLMRRKSFIHIALGSAAASFGGYAIASFFPSFLVRSHGMSPVEVGIYLGLILGIAGGTGFAGGGWFADRIGGKNKRTSLRGVAVATIIGWIFLFPVYLTDDPYWCLAFFVVPAVFSNFYLATTIAQTQGLVGLRMRGVASALLFFVLNIIGLGLGPQVTGILSDLLASGFGNESMRYALLIVGAVVGPWSALHYYRASKYIDDDLARVDEA